MIDLHKCRSCKNEHPAEAFQKNRAKKRGLQDFCRECQNGHINSLHRDQTPTVYMLTCVPTMERYIGSTTTGLDKRLWNHRTATNSGSTCNVHGCMRVFSDRAMWKMETLEEVVDGSQLREREQAWIESVGPELNTNAAYKEATV